MVETGKQSGPWVPPQRVTINHTASEMAKNSKDEEESRWMKRLHKLAYSLSK
jgi:hypothetical protein